MSNSEGKRSQALKYSGPEIPEFDGVTRRHLLIGGLAVAGMAAGSVLDVSSAAASVGSISTPRPAPARTGVKEVGVDAPQGGVKAKFFLDGTGRPLWTLSVQGREVVASSPLGFILDDGTDFTTGLLFVDAGRSCHQVQRYELRQGKVSTVHTLATQRTVTVRTPAGRVLRIDLWVSIQGAAVRYRTDIGHSTRVVTKETTGLTLRIPADGGAQFAQPYTKGAPKYQEFYLPRSDHRVTKLGDTVGSTVDSNAGAGFPLLSRTSDQFGDCWWVLASESGNDGAYPGCHVSQPLRNDSMGTVTYGITFPTDDEALGTFGSGSPQVTGNWSSPWRFVAVAKSPAELAQTTLATDLATPNRIGRAAWVKPGAASFSWLTDHDSPISLERVLPFFDLARSMGWPYSLVDAKWDQMTDATGIPVTLEQLVAEGEKRGIRLFLWYNSAGTNNDASANTPRDRLADPLMRRRELKRLSDLGVAGLKVDGWQSDKQELLALQRDLLEDAAQFRLHVVLHNTTIPRGWDRTYPHLLGYEAGIASEYYSNTKPYTDQIPEQTTIAAITRNAIGPFDFGTTLLRKGLVPGCDRYTTDAHELALTVIYQSGFNGFADGPDQYLEQSVGVRTLLRTVPLAWDETRYLSAEPTREIVVARRKGRTWWVAGINGLTDTISPSLDVSAPDYFRATGIPLDLIADLSLLGVSRRARITLFADSSATDRTLRQQHLEGNHLKVTTSPFGGFLAIIGGERF